jgi:hypothetical protein
MEKPTITQSMYPHSISCEDMKTVARRIKEAIGRTSACEFRVKDMGSGPEEAEQLFRAMNDWTTATFSAYVVMARPDGKVHRFNMTTFMEGVSPEERAELRFSGCQSDWMQIKIYDPYFFVSPDRIHNKVLEEPMLRQTFRFHHASLNDSHIQQVADFLVHIHNKLCAFPFPVSSSI